jgi:hypothetical protein
LKLEIQREIRIPKGPSHEAGGWGKYIQRGLSGSFHFNLPGVVLLPLGVRLPVFLHGEKTPVATAQVTQIIIEQDKGEKGPLSSIGFDYTRLIDHKIVKAKAP